MPSIHMNVEQVKAVLELMVQVDAEIEDMRNTLTNNVNAIGDDWVGNAALEFGQEYAELDKQLKDRLASLELLAERLRLEIAEWEAMAAQLA